MKVKTLLLGIFTSLSMLGCSKLSKDSSMGNSTNLFSSAQSFLNFGNSSSVWLEKIHFKVSKFVNNNSPVLMHVVLLHDKELFNNLSTLSAQDYFAQYEQIKKDSGGQAEFLVYEITPGQIIEAKEVPSTTSGEGVLIFARYRSPGDHRYSVGEEKEVLIHLDKTDFTVEKVG